jgi:hypothetical protein
VSDAEDFKDEVEVEVVHTDYSSRSAEELRDSKMFDRFISKVKEEMKEGTPFVQILASVIMTLFRPGFVVIGSPLSELSDDGIPIPDTMGIVTNSECDYTPSSLAIILQVIGEGIANELDMTFEQMTETPDE